VDISRKKTDGIQILHCNWIAVLWIFIL